MADTVLDAAPPKRPARMPFRRSNPALKLAPDAARRQGEATLLALKVMGKDAALAFLNGFSDSLSARPIDLAVASDSGLRRVQLELESLRPTGD